MYYVKKVRLFVNNVIDIYALISLFLQSFLEIFSSHFFHRLFGSIAVLWQKNQTAVGGGPAWEGISGWRREVQHCNTQVISPWPRITVHSSCSRRFPASNGCHSAMPSTPWHCQRLSTRQLIVIPEKVRVQHVSTQLKQVNSCQMISRTGCYFKKKTVMWNV